MSTELITASRLFLPKPPREEPRRPLEGPEIALIRYLGVHCGAGGQVTLPRRLQKAAASAIRLGLVQMWFRHERGVGLTRPFYALTDRGRQLAGALLCPRPKPRRTASVGSKGEKNVSTR